MQVFKCSTDGHYSISGLPDDGDGVGPRNVVYLNQLTRLEAREILLNHVAAKASSFITLFTHKLSHGE